MKGKDLLLDFFTKELTDEEKQKFLEKICSESDFVNEFSKLSQINSLIENDITSTSDLIPNYNRRKLFRRTVYISITVLAIIGLFWGVNYKTSKSDIGESIFKRYYEPFEVELIRSSSFKNSDAYLFYLYNTKEYFEITKIDIESINEEESKNFALLIQGISLIEVEKLNEAVVLFRKIDINSNYYSFARWYIMLININQNIFDDIENDLEYFISKNLIFMEKAEKIFLLLEDKGIIH